MLQIFQISYKDLGGVAPNTPSREIISLHPYTHPHIHADAKSGSRGMIPLAGCGTASHKKLTQNLPMLPRT